VSKQEHLNFRMWARQAR
jgi:hypothetical protein